MSHAQTDIETRMNADWRISEGMNEEKFSIAVGHLSEDAVDRILAVVNTMLEFEEGLIEYERNEEVA
tara:strand:- start:1151 stop:1351 length:201 start_codon:yes stop_codon:yes gene_type:complete